MCVCVLVFGLNLLVFLLCSFSFFSVLHDLCMFVLLPLLFPLWLFVSFFLLCSSLLVYRVAMLWCVCVIAFFFCCVRFVCFV